jgi:hypothetical protein
MKDVMISLVVGFPLTIIVGFISRAFLLPGLAVGTLLFGHRYISAITGLFCDWLFYAAICFAGLRTGRRMKSGAVEARIRKIL